MVHRYDASESIRGDYFIQVGEALDEWNFGAARSVHCQNDRGAMRQIQVDYWNVKSRRWIV
jgi:hypothetical protein